jgi:hypothetical protein
MSDVPPPDPDSWPPRQPPAGGPPGPGATPPPAGGPPGPGATPPPGWGPPPPPDYGVPGYAAAARGGPGFFASLFDLSFTSFVTVKLVKVLYVLAMVVIGLISVLQLIGALIAGDAAFLVASLVVVPLVALLALVYTRVLLELVMVLFRIGEDVGRAADALSRRPPP